MTLYHILKEFMTNIINTSLKDWTRNSKNVNYRELTEFFHKEFNYQELIKQAWECIFTITQGWIIIDEIVIEKSKVGKLKVVKRQYKSAGGYVTPSIAIVLAMWCNGIIRVPIAFHIKNPKKKETHIDAALRLLSWVRNRLKFRPLYVLFDAGFASQRLLKGIDNYGWVFVCKIPKTRYFNGIRIWRYKKQGFWNEWGRGKGSCSQKGRELLYM